MFTGYARSAQELAVAGPPATWLVEKTICFFSDIQFTLMWDKKSNKLLLFREW